MTNGEKSDHRNESVSAHIPKLAVSIIVLSGTTVILGYGGWVLLTISAKLGNPDPVTEDGTRHRERLVTSPTRNREFVQNNGRGTLPWKRDPNLIKSHTTEY